MNPVVNTWGFWSSQIQGVIINKGTSVIIKVNMAGSVSGSAFLPCAVCCRLISVTAAGLIRQHGPLRNRCPGSRQQPGPGSQSGVSSSLSQQPHGAVGMHAASSSSSQIPTVTQHCPLPLKCSVKILKRIPRASREQAASKLATILDAIVSNGDHASWCRLLAVQRAVFSCCRGRCQNGQTLLTCFYCEQEVEGGS